MEHVWSEEDMNPEILCLVVILDYKLMYLRNRALWIL